MSILYLQIKKLRKLFIKHSLSLKLNKTGQRWLSLHHHTLPLHLATPLATTIKVGFSLNLAMFHFIFALNMKYDFVCC